MRGPREALRVASNRARRRARPGASTAGQKPRVAATARNASADTTASASASPALHRPCGHVPDAGARVLRVDVAVGPAVERHGARPRADHAHDHRDDPQHGQRFVRHGEREDDGARGERHREDRVRECDERSVRAYAGQYTQDVAPASSDRPSGAARARCEERTRKDRRPGRRRSRRGPGVAPRATRPTSSRPSARAPSHVAMRTSSRAGHGREAIGQRARLGEHVERRIRRERVGPERRQDPRRARRQQRRQSRLDEQVRTRAEDDRRPPARDELELLGARVRQVDADAVRAERAEVVGQRDGRLAGPLEQVPAELQARLVPPGDGPVAVLEETSLGRVLREVEAHARPALAGLPGQPSYDRPVRRVQRVRRGRVRQLGRGPLADALLDDPGQGRRRAPRAGRARCRRPRERRGPRSPRRARGRTALSELLTSPTAIVPNDSRSATASLDRLRVVLGSRLGAHADHLLDPRDEAGAARDLPAHARSARGACARSRARAGATPRTRSASDAGVSREDLGGRARRRRSSPRASTTTAASRMTSPSPVISGIGMQRAHRWVLTRAT